MGPKNPVTMVGMIDRCWLFTFHTPEENAARLLPYPLVPVTHRGCAFWNVVVCHIEGMRPKGIPRFLGASYWHAGYRLYARYPTDRGEEIQGLYFVRSECDSAVMTTAGNLLTDFNFHTAPIRARETDASVDIDIESVDAPARVTVCRNSPATLAPDTVFDHLDQAARFLKYKPYGISLDRSGGGNIVRIVRDEHAWRARLVQARSAEWKFLADKNVRPEICYEVEPIQYQWNRAYHVRPKCEEPPVDAHASMRRLRVSDSARR